MTSEEIAALVNRANARCERGEVTEALADLDAAINADRAYWPALYNRAAIHAALAAGQRQDRESDEPRTRRERSHPHLRHAAS